MKSLIETTSVLLESFLFFLAFTALIALSWLSISTIGWWSVMVIPFIIFPLVIRCLGAYTTWANRRDFRRLESNQKVAQ